MKKNVINTNSKLGRKKEGENERKYKNIWISLNDNNDSQGDTISKETKE